MRNDDHVQYYCAACFLCAMMTQMILSCATCNLRAMMTTLNVSIATSVVYAIVVSNYFIGRL